MAYELTGFSKRLPHGDYRGYTVIAGWQLPNHNPDDKIRRLLFIAMHRDADTSYTEYIVGALYSDKTTITYFWTDDFDSAYEGYMGIRNASEYGYYLKKGNDEG